MTTELSPEQVDRQTQLAKRAGEAVDAVDRFINGNDSKYVAVAMGRMHPYLLNDLTGAMAIAVLMRTYDVLCPRQADAKDAWGSPVNAHPDHDGRIGCGAVVGALRTLGTFDGDPLVARRVWLQRLPGWSDE